MWHELKLFWYPLFHAGHLELLHHWYFWGTSDDHEELFVLPSWFNGTDINHLQPDSHHTHQSSARIRQFKFDHKSNEKPHQPTTSSSSSNHINILVSRTRKSSIHEAMYKSSKRQSSSQWPTLIVLCCQLQELEPKDGSSAGLTSHSIFFELSDCTQHLSNN